MTNKKRNQVRVIGGLWRSRRITFTDSPGLRPSGDRLRETLFNWLGHWTEGTRVLDLCAGSGILSIEALSRGAESAVLIEKEARVANIIRQQIDLLDAKTACLNCCDARDYLDQYQGDPFDLIFLDPPFARQSLYDDLISKLVTKPILADNSMIYIEVSKQAQIGVPDQWQLYKHKVIGEVQMRLFRQQRRESR